ncbi:hypothetical protein ACFXJ8_38685 [Nonomuraea sp. NPDC059194]
MIRPTFGLLAQKMWSGTPAGVAYEEFCERLSATAAWPGAEHVTVVR